MRAMEEIIGATLINGVKYEMKYDFKYGEVKIYKNDEFDWDWPGDETPTIDEIMEEFINRCVVPSFMAAADRVVCDIKERLREQARVEIQDQLDIEREYRESRGL